MSEIETEDVTLIRRIKYLTDLINNASTYQNNPSTGHTIQRPHQKSGHGYVGNKGQGYYPKKQTASSSEGKSYSNSWKNSKQKSADLKKFVWKKSNKSDSKSSSNTMPNNAVHTDSNQQGMTTRQQAHTIQSKCDEPSNAIFDVCTRERTCNSTLHSDKISQGRNPQNASKNSFSNEKNLRNSNIKISQISDYGVVDSTSFRSDSCEKSSSDNVQKKLSQIDLKCEKTLSQSKLLADDKAVTVASSNLSSGKDSEVFAIKKLTVVPNFVRKKMSLTDGSISSESNNCSSKSLSSSSSSSLSFSDHSSKNEKAQELNCETLMLPSDVRGKPLSVKSLKQANFQYSGPLSYHDQQSMAEPERPKNANVISHSLSLKSNSYNSDTVGKTKSFSESIKPPRDVIGLSEQLPGECSVPVVRFPNSVNQKSKTEKTLITETADTPQHSRNKVFVKPSFLKNYLDRKTTSSSSFGPSASPAESYHTCEKERKNISTQPMSSSIKDIVPDVSKSVSKKHYDLGIDAARPQSHETNSTSNQEREAVKSQLNLQLAQTEAKIQQLKRNIVNTKVTLGSAESIDLRRHKTSPVKSTIHHSQKSLSKVQRSRSVPIMKTTTFVNDGSKLNEKLNQRNLIFLPQHSQSQTNISQSHRNTGQYHGIKSKKSTKFRNLSHCKSQRLNKDKKIVFDPKYKLTRSTSENKTPLNNVEVVKFAPAKINVMANIIKSKYRFRRTNTSAPPKSYVHDNEMSNEKIVSSGNTTFSRPQAKVVKSKYKLRKFTRNAQTALPSASQSKYRLRKFTSSDTSPSASPSKYKLTNTKTVRSSIGNDHSNLSSQAPLPPPDVPSLQRQSFKFTQQGQLIYTPYGIQKYHTFSSNSASRSKHRKRNSKRVGYRRASLQHYTTRFNSQLSVNKKFVTKRPRRGKRQKPVRIRSKFIVLNGMLYKSSSTSLVRTSPVKLSSTTSTKPSLSAAELRIAKPFVGNNNTDGSKNETEGTINHVDIGGVTYVKTGQGTLERFYPSNTRAVASRVVSRSKAMVAAKHRKDNTKKKKLQYCLFYNRFGKCQRGEKCPYIHDPEKIAVCTRFLRGTCQVKGCLFLHKVDKDKMPVCSYFLRGVCIRDDCPYLHVNVGKKASVCQDFLRGFCPYGVKCKKKHTLECPAFSKTGHCPDGEKCRLSHKKVKKRKQLLKKPESTSVSQKRLADEAEESEDSNIPFKIRKLPTFISIAANQDEPVTDQMSNTEQKTGASVRIKPKF